MTDLIRFPLAIPTDAKFATINSVISVLDALRELHEVIGLSDSTEQHHKLAEICPTLADECNKLSQHLKQLGMTAQVLIRINNSAYSNEQSKESL